MKILCQTRSLQDAMQLVTAVVPSNATRPVLLCVNLKAEENRLLVQGTDLDLGLSVQVDEVEVKKVGSAVVPAMKLHSILRELNTDQLCMETDEGGKTLIVSSEKSLFKVPLEFVEEFPALEFTPPGPAVRIRRDALHRALRLTSIAAARDATRFQMHSVLIDCKADAIRMVSTDGKRMAISDLEDIRVSKEVQDHQYIVPLKGVDLLVRILGVEELEEIELHLDQSEVTYSSDRVSLSCRLVEGRFPDYERALPPAGGNVYEMPCGQLLVGLRQASLMTTKETHSVLFSLQDGDLVLSTKANNVGESRVELQLTPVDTSAGNLAINFNPSYFMDLLKVVDLDTITGRFKDQRTAGVLSFDADHLKYRHIVMPLVTHD